MNEPHIQRIVDTLFATNYAPRSPTAFIDDWAADVKAIENRLTALVDLLELSKRLQK